MKAENCNQAISKLAQAVDENTKAIGVNRKAVAKGELTVGEGDSARAVKTLDTLFLWLLRI